ncbi:Kinesin-like protein subito, partial [Dufourea novaeangliae]
CVDAHYSVWVSFAEIYNEIVYDLLSNETQKKRTSLKLATDVQGRAFIKGLKAVCVNSGSEAYQVLMAGQYNLKVAATALNARSSRSHCIFTIKLLKYYVENDSDSVEVSTFAFCDLAGSERLKKTSNIGDRLKEAQNINTSLLVLRRCLKAIHDGQLSKQKIEHVGPFRESKLTRLFQKALSGKEHIALIVNINPLPNLYIETQNVLNFSAIAKKIVIEQKQKIQKKKSRFSQIVSQSIKTVTDWDATELESEECHNTADDVVSGYVQAEDYDELVNENESLRKEIASLKSSALTRDLQIRQEMADTYTIMMKEIEVEWKNRIKDVEEQQEDVVQWSVKQVEDFSKQKLDQLSCRKRKRPSNAENDADDLKNMEELERENSRLTSKIVLLKSSVKELKESNQSLTVDKNKMSFELGMIKEDLKNVKNLLSTAQKDVCLDADSGFYVEELKSQLFAKQEQVKKLKVILNDAKKEYIAITTQVREKEYVIKEQEELFEKQYRIDELEADLESVSICLTEKTKSVEVLEDKLESQNKKMTDYENKMQDMQEQLSKFESEKLLLLDEIKLLKKTALTRNIINDIECKNDVLGKSYDLKSISDQISKLQVNSTEPKVENEKAVQHEIEIETAEIGCQVHTEAEVEQVHSIESELQNKSSQTIESTTTEEITQTSFIEEYNESDVALAELEKITVKYDDLKSQHKEKCWMLEELEQEILCLKQKLESLDDESNSNKLVIEEYKQSNESLQKQLTLIRDSKTQLEETLRDSDNVKTTLETKISGYEEQLNKFEKELSHVKDNLNKSENELSHAKNDLNKSEEELSHVKDDYNQCMEKLNILQADFNSHISKCKDEHEETINASAAKFAELKHNMESISELRLQMKDLSLEFCQHEKEHLQKLLDENNDKLLEFEDRLKHAKEIQEKKDAVIMFLQAGQILFIQQIIANSIYLATI